MTRMNEQKCRPGRRRHRRHKEVLNRTMVCVKTPLVRLEKLGNLPRKPLFLLKTPAATDSYH